jgi:hypothetical protein
MEQFHGWPTTKLMHKADITWSSFTGLVQVYADQMVDRNILFKINNVTVTWRSVFHIIQVNVSSYLVGGLKVVEEVHQQFKSDGYTKFYGNKKRQLKEVAHN